MEIYWFRYADDFLILHKFISILALFMTGTTHEKDVTEAADIPELPHP